MPPSVMRPVEPDGIGGLKPSQGLAQTGTPAPDQQVIVVVHQHESVDFGPKAFWQLGHPPKKPSPILVRPID
jgi:hypothetical protein